MCRALFEAEAEAEEEGIAMSGVFVHGMGAVSPAGWGVEALMAALERNEPLPVVPLAQPGRSQALRSRPVPPPANRPPCLAHPRLRRASPIAQHVVAAAFEALGEDAAKVQAGALRLGVIVCTLAGSVVYSRRFYEEVLRDPATASPLLFPETVFNAPASHLAACLGSPAINYSLVGDEGAFLGGLALGAGWLAEGRVDGCLVIGAEELDWIVAVAARLFDRSSILAGGAGAVYLKGGAGRGVELSAITDAFPFTRRQPRALAARRMREQLPPESVGAALCLGTQGAGRRDADELAAWADWRGPRLAPKAILGEAFLASAAWQGVAACAALRAGRFAAVTVSVVGANEQAIGARLVATP
jgi:3-oxoacyl-(acyl-carrier-protein) synthase